MTISDIKNDSIFKILFLKIKSEITLKTKTIIEPIINIIKNLLGKISIVIKTNNIIKNKIKKIPFNK